MPLDLFIHPGSFHGPKVGEDGREEISILEVAASEGRATDDTQQGDMGRVKVLSQLAAPKKKRKRKKKKKKGAGAGETNFVETPIGNFTLMNVERSLRCDLFFRMNTD